MRRVWVYGFLLALTAVVVLVFSAGCGVYRLYHLTRGRRNRDAGLPCPHCVRRAFPVEGTTARYRCSNCARRFDGPQHFG
jgi:hypothetical protein